MDDSTRLTLIYIFFFQDATDVRYSESFHFKAIELSAVSNSYKMTLFHTTFIQSLL